MKSNNPALGQLLLENLKSLPVAINAIVLIIILSIIGTIVPQEQPISGDFNIRESNRAQVTALIQMHPEPWREILQHLNLEYMNVEEFKLYLEKYGQLRFVILKILGFTNIYNVWYFNFLLFWVGCSALVCSYTRFSGLLKNYQLHSTKKLVRGWASFFLHLSLFVILSAGIINNTWGVSGLITLEENKKNQVIIDATANKHWLIKLLIKPFTKPQAYEIELVKFEIPLELFPSPQGIKSSKDKDSLTFEQLAIKDFISHIKIYDANTTIPAKVSVNQPLVYKGLKLYQMSYQLQARLKIKDKTKKTERLLPLSPRLPVQATEMGYIELFDNAQLQNDQDPVFELVDIKAGNLWKANHRLGYQPPIAKVNIYHPATGRVELSTIVSTTKPVSYKNLELLLDTRLVYQSVLSYKLSPAEWWMYLGFTLLILSSSVFIFTLGKNK